jgi:hypothetical protein
MKVEDKVKSAEEAVEEVGKLEIELPISKAERIVLAHWLSRIVSACYDRGFADGNKSNVS